MNTVLHVDNSSLYKKLLKEKFTEFGWRYISAGGMSEALALLEKSEVNLMITALELEDGSGEDLVRRINTGTHREVPVVIITSNESVEIRKKLFSLGAIDFIPKNITEEQLRRYIEKLIKRDVLSDRMKDLKIAVLDDSELDLKYMKSILGFHGLENIDYYKNPEDLLGSGTRYDIYFVDVVMPKLSGDQVVYRLRSEHRSSVIIAISGIDHFKTISGILLSGADDYILKPFNESVFMARLKTSVRTFLLIRDVEEKNETLNRMIITDRLTGLYNHQYLYEQAENEVKKAGRYGRKLSLAMFDIDDFKKINDTHGHQVGDAVLVKIAQAIKKTVREIDIVGRYGGEEFLIILPETGLDSAYSLAERIRAGIEKLNHGLDGRVITISGGVAELGKENSYELVGKADGLLYRAKKAGKNRVEKQ